MKNKKYIFVFFGLTVLFLVAYYIPYFYFSGPWLNDDIRYEDDAYNENPILWETGYAKQIDAPEIETAINYEYFLILEDNHVSVYETDKDTLYFKTSIRKNSLTDEEIVELTEGKYILDVDELYDFLESHTS
ncbi:MAG: hypothetical protein E7270_07515 [Lachnospiraceae bacterium]|nr:hypothetical protein [Lachnospiraceae bacterium]